MKLLHIIKEFTETGNVDTIIQDQEAPENEITVVRLKEDKDYARLVDLIFASDQVYTW
ncbi:MAG: hypothetical protein ACYDET_06585 [Thermoleophilia bacterium]|jgi:hypothetical protein|nr:hypothetical protein [Actinomycetota bacterium]